ncbi:hypothetical protein ACFXJ8_25065 [Nonomuraea sp. NPDC059194]|uniref:hypothetical protein n=1 Tax=Nonomuraea sp. NPDC059194 TaxID=3346764 RepID=UPI0036916219
MDPRAFPPRLVLDPSLPGEVAAQLRAGPHAMHMARAGRQHEPTRNSALLFVLPGFLMLIWLVIGSAGMIVALVGMSLIALMRWMATDEGNRVAKRRLRLAYEHHDRYVLPEDLDYPCQVLLRRAQDAADRILASEVHKAGLIDSIDNQVTLPDEVWQIARRLAKLSRMHDEHRRIVPTDLPRNLRAAFAPYAGALDQAWTSLSQRVRTLEEYALQVLKADDVYRAHRRLEMLAARTPDYQRLLAETVRDDLALPHIQQLADQARHVRALFEESIQEARRAAGHLVRTPLS